MIYCTPYIYVYTYPLTHTYINTYIHVFIYIHTHACMHINVCVCIDTICVFTRYTEKKINEWSAYTIFIQYTYKYVYICIYTCMFNHIHILHILRVKRIRLRVKGGTIIYKSRTTLTRDRLNVSKINIVTCILPV